MAGSSRHNYTRRLAEYLTGINRQSLSDQLRDKLTLHILDTLGAGLFGTTTPWNRQVREVALSWGGRPDAGVWATDAVLPVPSAVLVNGMACHSFELDDTHVHSAVHPGSGTVSAALAVAQAAGQGAYQDDEVLVAILAGYEASIRIGIAAGAASFERGFYPPGISLAFGSAAVAGKLYGFDGDLMTHCLALTATQASGLYSPTSLKRFNIGNGARAGVVAAQLAKAGLKGPQDPLEAPVGGFGEAFANRVNWDGALEGMGQRFCIWDVGLKRYSCSRPNHTAIDAVAEIRSRRGGLKSDEVEEIDIVCSTPSYRYGVGFEVKDTPSCLHEHRLLRRGHAGVRRGLRGAVRREGHRQSGDEEDRGPHPRQGQ